MGWSLEKRFSTRIEKNLRTVGENKREKKVKIITFNWNSQVSLQAHDEEE